tara:strand:+ start:5907 stop:6758 length:852 start_codon:yes stop_codon:yes gene_type:complete
MTNLANDIFPAHELSDEADDVKVDDREKFPCEHCSGTGTWHGGRNRRGVSKCFACKGSGFFMTSRFDRQKAKASRVVSKAKKLDNAQQAFLEQNPEMAAVLISCLKWRDWNDFAGSLYSQFETRGSLSEKQVQAALRMAAKIEATQAAKAEAQEETAVSIDLSPIRDMFDTAVGNGLMRPKYRAEGLVISRAPDGGKNAGHLYVKTVDGEYQGKLTPDHRFLPVGSAAAETTPALQAIAVDPEEAAIRYGRQTGSCGCCGRDLTNKESIERGIGPICADKWGF